MLWQAVYLFNDNKININNLNNKLKSFGVELYCLLRLSEDNYLYKHFLYIRYYEEKNVCNRE